MPPAKKRPATPRAKTVRTRRRLTLLVIDNEPLRAEAVAEYLAVEEEIGGARERLEEFETGDVPAYERWEARVFGGMLTKLRETNLAIDDKRRLLEEINQEMFWTGCSEVTAYQRVMDARANPEAAHSARRQEAEEPPPRRRKDEPDSSESDDFPFLPEDFDIEAYERSPRSVQQQFRQSVEAMGRLYEEISGNPAPSFEDLLERERAKKRRRGRGRAADPQEDWESAETQPQTVDSRIKELYRRLVRMLHPDSSGDHSARARELWHELQEAYRTHDLERMEAVAGRADLGANGSTASLSIGLLRRMIRDLREALQGMRAQLARARKNPAWNFRRRGKELPQMEKKRRDALQKGLEHATWTLEEFTQELERLAKRAAKRMEKRVQKKAKPAPRPKKTGKSKAAPKSRDGVQFEFF